MRVLDEIVEEEYANACEIACNARIIQRRMSIDAVVHLAVAASFTLAGTVNLVIGRTVVGCLYLTCAAGLTANVMLSWHYRRKWAHIAMAWDVDHWHDGAMQIQIPKPWTINIGWFDESRHFHYQRIGPAFRWWWVALAYGLIRYAFGKKHWTQFDLFKFVPHEPIKKEGGSCSR